MEDDELIDPKQPIKPAGDKKKIIILLLIVIAMIIVLGAGAYFYWQFSDSSKATNSTASSQRSQSNSQSISSQSRSLASSQSSSKASAGCAKTYTSDDELMKEGWGSYANPAFGLSFSYPNDWELVQDNENQLTLTSPEDDGITLQVRKATAADIGFSDYTIESTSNVTVNCTAGTKTVYAFDPDRRIVATSVTKDGVKYLFTTSFAYQGASISGDIFDLDTLILKTVSFL